MRGRHGGNQQFYDTAKVCYCCHSAGTSAVRFFDVADRFFVHQGKRSFASSRRRRGAGIILKVVGGEELGQKQIQRAKDGFSSATQTKGRLLGLETVCLTEERVWEDLAS